MHGKAKITFFGHAMFQIESSEGIRIGLDPYNRQVKDSLPDVSSDITLISHDHFDHSNTALFKGEPEVINTPGKKTIRGVNIEGLKTYHDRSAGSKRGENIIFKFEVDKIIFAHMGDLGHMPAEDQVKKLKDVDVLMLPVGGIYTIDYRDAYKLIQDIGPNIAIPMHYKQQDTKIDVDTVNNFLEEVKSYKDVGHSVQIAKQELPEETEIWVLKSS